MCRRSRGGRLRGGRRGSHPRRQGIGTRGRRDSSECCSSRPWEARSRRRGRHCTSPGWDTAAGAGGHCGRPSAAATQRATCGQACATREGGRVRQQGSQFIANEDLSLTTWWLADLVGRRRAFAGRLGRASWLRLFCTITGRRFVTAAAYGGQWWTGEDKVRRTREGVVDATPVVQFGSAAG